MPARQTAPLAWRPFKDAPGVELSVEGLIADNVAAEVACGSDDVPELRNCAWFFDAVVRQGVAVWAQRNKVDNGIQLVPVTEQCRRHYVVDVDVACAGVAVRGLE